MGLVETNWLLLELPIFISSAVRPFAFVPGGRSKRCQVVVTAAFRVLMVVGPEALLLRILMVSVCGVLAARR